MEKILDSLKNSNIVLFGAGQNGKSILEQLINRGITPAYFVDNNREITVVKHTEKFGEEHTFSVHPPEALLGEDKSNLKIIITPDAPWYAEIESQIKEMGLGKCIFAGITCCGEIINLLGFFHDTLGFCCESSSDFNGTRPKFPYLDTAEETILNFLRKRESLWAELSGWGDIDVAKPCVNCRRLKNHHLFFDKKIKIINVGCYPSICQAKCIYCSEHTKPQNTYEVAKHSRYPKMIAEMILYLQKNNLIDDNCVILFSPAEISIMPHKDFLLDATAGYRARFLTNSFVFEPKIANSLKKNRSHIEVSLDSGTRATFKLVKGLDLFEKTIDNLKRYRDYGEIIIKYNILSGVNESDSDIDGIIGVLKALNINSLRLSFDYNMPLRTAFFPIAKFVNRLKENGLSFVFHTYYNAQQIDNFIEQYYTPEYQSDLEHKNNHLREVFQSKYINDYKAYIQYVYHTEIKDLIECFKEGTRFASLGYAKNNKYIVSAFEKMAGIPLQIPDLPYKESYEAIKDSADIFVIRNKGKFNEIKTYIESDGGDERRLVDVEKYYFSFEPAKLFLERNMLEGYLK